MCHQIGLNVQGGIVAPPRMRFVLYECGMRVHSGRPFMKFGSSYFHYKKKISAVADLLVALNR